jgi:hypothetical protein
MAVKHIRSQLKTALAMGLDGVLRLALTERGNNLFTPFLGALPRSIRLPFSVPVKRLGADIHKRWLAPFDKPFEHPRLPRTGPLQMLDRIVQVDTRTSKRNFHVDALTRVRLCLKSLLRIRMPDTSAL